jgi:DNA-directed RNA polymerase specialized sigma subunit
MKIPLNFGQDKKRTTDQANSKVLERDILAAQQGDWNAKNNLVRTFTPLLTTLATKRTSEVAKINDYIEAGKKGLFAATKKYKQGTADKFNFLVLDLVEKEMDNMGKKGGFLSKLFGS